MLDEAVAKASQASRAFQDLKLRSIEYSSAVTKQSDVVKQLSNVRAREIQSVKDLQAASTPYIQNIATANKSLKSYESLLASTTKERQKLQNTTNADASKFLDLTRKEKNYQDIIKVTKGVIDENKTALANLTKEKQEHTNN